MEIEMQLFMSKSITFHVKIMVKINFNMVHSNSTSNTNPLRVEHFGISPTQCEPQTFGNYNYIHFYFFVNSFRK